MSTSLLHIADLHLDRAFAGMGCQGELAIRRRLGLRDALRRAGRTAAERGCVAVTIGGDLYEHDRAGADTALFLVETFASWAPMEVLVAPGNHDALLAGSIYSRTEWPANVHIFDTAELRPHRLAGGITVWGLAHLEPAWQGDPLACDRPGGGDVNLALFHGAELGSRPDGKSIHGPFHACRHARARLRRGALRPLPPAPHRRGIAAALPGQPRAAHLRRVRAARPGDRDRRRPRAVAYEAVDDNRWTARTAIADVSGARSLADVVDASGAAAALACAGLDPERTMLRLDLVGEIDQAVSTDSFTVETSVRDGCGAAGVRVRDLTSPALSVAAIAGDASVRGAFARAVAAAAEAADEAQREVLDDALRYGLQALGGAEIGLR